MSDSPLVTTPASHKNGDRAMYDAMLLRRAAVASLVAKGLTIDGIRAELNRQNIVNYDTGKPYGYKTIMRDLEHIRLTWKTLISLPRSEHRARHMSEINEIKRQAYDSGNGALALKAIAQEMKLLGTDTNSPDDVGVDSDLVLSLIEAMRKRGINPAEVFETMLKQISAGDNNYVTSQ